MRIALGRAQTRMAEQLLNRAEVGARCNRCVCERMTQGVRADAGPFGAVGNRNAAPWAIDNCGRSSGPR